MIPMQTNQTNRIHWSIQHQKFAPHSLTTLEKLGGNGGPDWEKFEPVVGCYGGAERGVGRNPNRKHTIALISAVRCRPEFVFGDRLFFTPPAINGPTDLLRSPSTHVGQIPEMNPVKYVDYGKI